MTEPLILRRAALSDALAIRELSKAAYAKWVPLIAREPMPMAVNYERAITEHVIDLMKREENSSL
jgi:hypothetical protein